MEKKQYKRTHFLINKKFQFHYMGLVFLFCLIISSSILFSFYFGFKNVIYDEFSWKKILNKLQTIDRIAGYEEMRQRYRQSDRSDEDIETVKMAREASMLSKNQEELFTYFLKKITREVVVELSALILIISLGTVFMTHKIAGPLYRIRMLLNEVQKGNLDVNFKLREGDQLQGLAHALNDLIGNYRSVVKELIHTADELRIKCTALEEKTNDQLVKEELSSIKNKIKTITNICHRLSNRIV